jgi:uncharacterized protein YndB with AHSA1/START domain
MKNVKRVELTTPTDREVVFTGSFAAPRHLVFDALTKPEYLPRWLDAPGRKLELCEVDLRVGGAYRYVWRGEGKKDVGMHGIFREVSPPDRYVRTEAWEDWEAGEILVTVELVEKSKVTKATTTVLFPSKEVRDEVLKAGMEHGLEASFITLAGVIAEIVEAKA